MDMNEDLLDDPEFQLLIQKYLEYIMKSIPELKAKLNKRNFEEIKDFGHNLKGVAKGYGFDELGKLGSKIETASSSENFDLLKNLISDFEASLKKECQRFKGKFQT